MADDLIGELQRALEHAELRLHYQPILSTRHLNAAGVEALIRWAHPQRGLLGPGAFLPAVENHPLIIDIGRWVLHEACRVTRNWQNTLPHHGELGVAVNVAPRQWCHDALLDHVKEALLASNLPPRSLKLEITEGSLMTDAKLAVKTLMSVREMGVRTSIDDFGTGYSSLGYLKSFPVDTLKIDRCFVAGLGRERSCDEIARMIVGLAHSLGMDVVAEGVENESQMAAICGMACGYAQGFLLARPMPELTTRAFLVRNEELRVPRVPSEEPAPTQQISESPVRRTITGAPSILVCSGPAAGRLMSLDKGEVIVGRSRSAHLTVRDNSLSRMHARVFIDPNGRLVLEDLDSKNGTYCNEVPVHRCPLRGGDIIRMGHTVLEVCADASRYEGMRTASGKVYVRKP